MYLEFHEALDCGLFQGHRAEANRNNRVVPAWSLSAHALVLSHAHLDYERDVQQGWNIKGVVWNTRASTDS